MASARSRDSSRQYGLRKPFFWRNRLLSRTLPHSALPPRIESANAALSSPRPSMARSHSDDRPPKGALGTGALSAPLTLSGLFANLVALPLQLARQNVRHSAGSLFRSLPCWLNRGVANCRVSPDFDTGGFSRSYNPVPTLSPKLEVSFSYLRRRFLGLVTVRSGLPV